MSESSPKTLIVEDSFALAKKGAELFLEISRESIQSRGRFLVALSGGSTPLKMYDILAQEPFSSQIDWAKIHIFLSDERFVLESDEASNFGPLKKILLDKISIPQENIHPVVTQITTPELVAHEYENELKKISGVEIPSLDAIFLGIGPDGHTASLFPGIYTPEENEPLVLAIHNSPKPPSERISFSMRLINNAQNVIFLANGSEKATVLKEILENGTSEKILPARMARPKNGNLIWLLDKTVASLLSN